MRLMERINNIRDTNFKFIFQSIYHKCLEASDPMNAIDLRNYYYKNKYAINWELNLPYDVHL